jgi:tRNA(Arg) A34 adenosine deaminase TadA
LTRRELSVTRLAERRVTVNSRREISRRVEVTDYSHTRLVEVRPDLWVRALELAWASYYAGTTPVGALVIAPNGDVVAEGRGRRYEARRDDRQLSHCHIAHAEVNALALLPPTRSYEDHVLITTLEPCCMCVGAAVQSKVVDMRFAGRDPYGGASDLEITTPQALRRPLTVAGPDRGSFGFFAELLHIMWLARQHSGPPLDTQRALGAVYELGTSSRVVELFDQLRRTEAPFMVAVAAAAELREQQGGET